MGDSDTEYFVVSGEDGTVEGFAILQGIQSSTTRFFSSGLPSARRTVGLAGFCWITRCRGCSSIMVRTGFWLDVFETNGRARRVYQAYGFRYDGVMREAILLDGEYHTLALMSLLDREYTASQQRGADAVTSALRS